MVHWYSWVEHRWGPKEIIICGFNRRTLRAYAEAVTFFRIHEDSYAAVFGGKGSACALSAGTSVWRDHQGTRNSHQNLRLREQRSLFSRLCWDQHRYHHQNHPIFGRGEGGGNKGRKVWMIVDLTTNQLIFLKTFLAS